MKNVPMRFCGYSLHHNPAVLKIENTGNIRELSSPCCEPDSMHLGNRLRRISGEGELYGEDCIAQFRELYGLFERGERGVLVLPRMPALYAYLRELKMIAEPQENVLGYRFTFLEAQSPGRDNSIVDTYDTIAAGESLWDIGYRYGVPLETLVRLNPQIKYIDCLDENERVRLC